MTNDRDLSKIKINSVIHEFKDTKSRQDLSELLGEHDLTALSNSAWTETIDAVNDSDNIVTSKAIKEYADAVGFGTELAEPDEEGKPDITPSEDTCHRIYLVWDRRADYYKAWITARILDNEYVWVLVSGSDKNSPVRTVNDIPADSNGNIEIEIPSLDGYATESWVEAKDYLVDSDLDGYATENWVNDKHYLVSNDLNGYATEYWVNNKGYLTPSALDGYATQTWVNNQEFIKSDDLTDYATKQWVENKDFVTSDDLDGYATEQWVENKDYATEDWVQSQDFVTSQEAGTNYYSKTDVNNLLNTKQDTLTAGANISIINNVISSTANAGTMGRAFVTDITVGHLQSGTQINADDTVSSILYRILYNRPSGSLFIYQGATANLPVTIDSTWTSREVTSAIVDTGIDLYYNTASKSYIAFAIPASLGNLAHVYQNDLTTFDLIGDLDVLNVTYEGESYLLYRFTEKSTAGQDKYTLQWR